MLNLQDQRVLILGLGASGLAMARWCARHGAQVTVADTRDAPPQLAALREQVPGALFVPGTFSAELVEGKDLHAVYRSPGLSPAAVAPVFAPVLVAIQQVSTRAQGELDLFFEALGALKADNGYSPAVLAVTGTNGKTTVTSLTGQLVARAGLSVAVAGNIGPTLLDTLSAHIDAGTLPQAWVLELSSFQLDSTATFEPTAATVLNLSQDHLDWHGDMPAYAAAKARIFGQTGLMLLNRDDPAVMAMLPKAELPSGKGKSTKAEPVRTHVTFGGDLPQRPGDYGIETVNGMAWLVRAMPADDTHGSRRTRAQPREDDAAELVLQRLMPADALRIRGRHNAVNALAALALASAAGCSLAPMLYGLREYRGEPHRVELVGLLNDVAYYDDSKGTNVGATVAALQGLGAEQKIVVILGGEGKGQDFAPLLSAVARHARAVLLIGRDGPSIGEALASAGVPLHSAATLPEAVQHASQLAQAGDAVLLSPACASFDMFDDYAHRARVFCAAVAELAAEAGVELAELP